MWVVFFIIFPSFWLLYLPFPYFSVALSGLPQITISPEANPAEYEVGEPAILECYSTGDPVPVVHWMKRDDDVGLQLMDSFEFDQSRAVYYIPKLRVDDSGVYVCRAENSVGSVEKSLVINGKVPSVMSIVLEDYVHFQSVNLLVTFQHFQSGQLGELGRHLIFIFQGIILSVCFLLILYLFLVFICSGREGTPRGTTRNCNWRNGVDRRRRREGSVHMLVTW